jgi:hypothetical protein
MNLDNYLMKYKVQNLDKLFEDDGNYNRDPHVYNIQRLLMDNHQ